MGKDPYDSFGLDIGDAILRVVRLGAHGAVTSYGERALAPGVVRHGRIADAGALCSSVRELIASVQGAPIAKKAWAYVGFPDTHVLIRQFDYPSGTRGRNLRKLILADFEKEFPGMEEEKSLSWERIEPMKEHEPVAVLAALASKRAVDEYVAAFRACRLRVGGMQAASIAVANALVPGGLAGGNPAARASADGSVFVDLRSGHATMTFFDLGSVQFVLTVERPSAPDAEFAARIRERLILGVDWHERRRGGKFRRVVTVGLVGPAAALARELRSGGWFDVVEGDCLANADKGASVAELPNAYAAAVGLALRTEL